MKRNFQILILIFSIGLLMINLCFNSLISLQEESETVELESIPKDIKFVTIYLHLYPQVRMSLIFAARYFTPNIIGGIIAMTTHVIEIPPEYGL